MTARIYVGTYAKYNNGSIRGGWLNLEDYSNKEEFLAACAELHMGESDPEFMFQDYEGFPRSFYCESNVSDELFDWLALDEADRELLSVYYLNVDSSADIDKVRDAFIGKYDSEAHWAESYLDDTDGLEGVPEHLKNYIDFEAYGRDARISGDIDFIRHEGELWAFYANV